MYNKYMQCAIDEAVLSLKLGEMPVGAVVVKDGIIIGKGHNLKETEKDATQHAEINAIKDACINIGNWRLNDASLYVTLEPCPMCAGAIIESRIKRVYIGAESRDSGAAGTAYDFLNKKVDVYFGIMEDDCKKLISDFFSRLRQIRRDG
ncbi:nucleoside deaminase [Thermoanaerobacterium thermosaccharolyticum]|uniref:nucleoside deaminase n=1 Tax=Thermoanaerobacterium thermosaccharolyticum TaxID=1517 RepID=UPI0020A532A4|nr:nucleoside deaminase [Thermoanaerobacterium thermosaccharolyticum]